MSGRGDIVGCLKDGHWHNISRLQVRALQFLVGINRARFDFGSVRGGDAVRERGVTFVRLIARSGSGACEERKNGGCSDDMFHDSLTL